ncbi:Adenylate cyclase [Minicystis rosea]|nr:Adenylate cyclase [Minicystis rosea]
MCSVPRMNRGELLAGRFELEGVAGAGGMGQVFRARDRETGAPVAIKMLLAERELDRPRFEREARMLAELSHPAIVRHVAHGSAASGEPYLAMEWLEGEDLATRLLDGPLTIDESVAIARQAAEALGAAHARGIVHRDLKPTNLFLVDRDVTRLRLLDFGIARLGGMPRMTRTGVFVGTPGYVAPEQARADHPLDPRSDVFSLGCVLFECLTGKPAFSGDHLMAILMKIVFADLPRVRALRPDVPADLEALLARMLAKDPAERPSDGAAVAEELAALGTLGSPRSAMNAPLAALTAGERRALSLVLIGPEPSSECAEAETLGDAEVAAASEALRLAVSACGGRLEHLAGGSMVVTMAGAELAKDEAAQAARCALVLGDHVGGRPLVLVTGRGELAGSLPMGDAIDRAVSMMAARTHLRAPEGHRGALIAMDELTAALLDARFEVRETDAGLFLAGEHELAEGTRTLLGKATPCVGRDRELSLLEHTFAECAEEPVARAVLVTAPAGIGKSRLAHELIRRVRANTPDAAIWIGRGDSLRAGSPFALLGQVLRNACGIRDGEPLAARRAKLLARVRERVAPGEVRRVAELLGELVGTPLDGSSARPAAALPDAQGMGDEMKAAWEDFLAAECAARPVLVVLEDLHWGDQPTLSLVDGAIRALSGSPWMVLALARPEVHALFPRLASERRFQEIQLMELTRKASARLVRLVLGDQVSAETAERLSAHADGNAFYLEELIRATAERRGEALPETVVTMVQSRLRRLDSESRRVLRAASVFGETFWSGGVTSLLGGPQHASLVSDKLADLATQELVVRRPESRFPSEDELAFRHALMREGAYAMLTESDRALGHGLAAEWLEERGEIDPLVLAEHFEHGGQPDRAGLHYLRAAELCYRRGEMIAAIGCARRGLSCEVPASTRTPLLSLLSVSHAWCNEWDLAVPPRRR